MEVAVLDQTVSSFILIIDRYLMDVYMTVALSYVVFVFTDGKKLSIKRAHLSYKQNHNILFYQSIYCTISIDFLS